jgi:transcriptional activator of cad operon
MDRPGATILRIGSWCVNPMLGEISRDGETARVEARTMRLLLCLAEHAGDVVSIDDLLNQVWPDVAVSPDSVYQAVTSLRRLLGDDPKQPTYIATVPRLGYRMIATVIPRIDPAITEPASTQPTPSSRLAAGYPWAAVTSIFIGLALVGVFLFHGTLTNHNHPASATFAAQPQKSIAVLPFLDLTDGMHEEEIRRWHDRGTHR